MVGPEGNDVFLVDLSGEEPGEPVRVTPEPVMSALPTGPKLRWAPSSLALAFDAQTGGGAIFYVDMSGPVPGEPTSIVPEGVGAGWKFAWSADSRWIAFESEDAEERRPVWAVDVSGDSPGEAVALGEGSIAESPFGRVPWHPSMNGLLMWKDGVKWIDLSSGTPSEVALDLPDDTPELAWSPTGDHLAVVYYDGSIRLGVVEFDGVSFGPMRELEGILPPQPNHHAWSPDGTRLAYRTDGVARIADVSQDPPVTFPVADVEATDIIWLGNDRIAVATGSDVLTADVGPSSTSTPESATMEDGVRVYAVSPDRGALVFLTTVDDGYAVPHVVELDGAGGPRQLSDTETLRAEFSPSSMRVLFQVVEDSMAEWMVADRSGDGPAVATGIIERHGFPVFWSPEDDRLLWRKDIFVDVGELYYNDLRDEVPGPPIRIAPADPGDRNVGEFAWAPAP